MYTNEQLSLFEFLIAAENEGISVEALAAKLHSSVDEVNQLLDVMRKFIEREGDIVYLSEEAFEEAEYAISQFRDVALDPVSENKSKYHFGYWHFGWVVLLVVLWIGYFVMRSQKQEKVTIDFDQQNLQEQVDQARNNSNEEVIIQGEE